MSSFLLLWCLSLYLRFSAHRLDQHVFLPIAPPMLFYPHPSDMTQFRLFTFVALPIGHGMTSGERINQMTTKCRMTTTNGTTNILPPATRQLDQDRFFRAAPKRVNALRVSQCVGHHGHGFMGRGISFVAFVDAIISRTKPTRILLTFDTWPLSTRSLVRPNRYSE